MRVVIGLLALCLSIAGQAQQRLVVAGGELTEIVYALDAGDRLVAVDSTSNYPAAARQLPKLGYVRALPVEGTLALKPDLVLLSGEAGPPPAVAQLKQATEVRLIDPEWSPAGLLARVEQVAEALELQARGEQLNAGLRERFAALDQRLPLADPPRTLLVLSAGRHGVQVAGKGTQGQALLDALGLPNVTDGEGYKPLNAEAVLAANPQLIIIAETRPGSFQPEQLPLLESTDAGAHGRVLVDDGMRLLGFGPRLPDAMEAVLEVATGEGR
ncbi:hemin ABC transporter substrate-binding protein [Alloalcanivorax sp. C16-1]|uniref:heme/hemin ABC transporter substrate-binding protein n=1 Tax=Alloalcanivorax sp. C16-1 TaxID=3390051 RepID=UPI003970792E